MSQSALPESAKGRRSSGLLARLAYLWCRNMHHSPMWPIHGRYQCRKCHRYHDVTWDSPKSQPPPR